MVYSIVHRKRFIEECREILPGKEVLDYIEFKESLQLIFEDESAYNANFIYKKKKLLKKYYNNESGVLAKEIINFITEKLNETS